MVDIHAILFAILVADALLVMAFGLVQAAILLFDIRRSAWMDRMPTATFALLASSFAAGALLWGADFAFGGA